MTMPRARVAFAATAAAALTVACSTAAAPAGAAPAPVCASVTVAFRTATGHEADLPMTLCGMRRGAWICDVTKGTWGEANARLSCSRAAAR
jgi:hypothetical protein